MSAETNDLIGGGELHMGSTPARPAAPDGKQGDKSPASVPIAEHEAWCRTQMRSDWGYCNCGAETAEQPARPAQETGAPSFTMKESEWSALGEKGQKAMLEMVKAVHEAHKDGTLPTDSEEKAEWPDFIGSGGKAPSEQPTQPSEESRAEWARPNQPSTAGGVGRQGPGLGLGLGDKIEPSAESRERARPFVIDLGSPARKAAEKVVDDWYSPMALKAIWLPFESRVVLMEAIATALEEARRDVYKRATEEEAKMAAKLGEAEAEAKRVVDRCYASSKGGFSDEDYNIIVSEVGTALEKAEAERDRLRAENAELQRVNRETCAAFSKKAEELGDAEEKLRVAREALTLAI